MIILSDLAPCLLKLWSTHAGPMFTRGSVVMGLATTVSWRGCYAVVVQAKNNHGAMQSLLMGMFCVHVCAFCYSFSNYFCNWAQYFDTLRDTTCYMWQVWGTQTTIIYEWTSCIQRCQHKPKPVQHTTGLSMRSVKLALCWCNWVSK